MNLILAGSVWLYSTFKKTKVTTLLAFLSSFNFQSSFFHSAFALCLFFPHRPCSKKFRLLVCFLFLFSKYFLCVAPSSLSLPFLSILNILLPLITYSSVHPSFNVVYQKWSLFLFSHYKFNLFHFIFILLCICSTFCLSPLRANFSLQKVNLVPCFKQRFSPVPRGLQRDVVYLGWPIAPS